jgi:CheY-like chemotaxis protein/signal transduction histidine kinase
VAASIHQTRLKALRSLASVLNQPNAALSVADALDSCMSPSHAKAGAVYSTHPKLHLLASNGPTGPGVPSSVLYEVMSSFSERAATEGKILRFSNNRPNREYLRHVRSLAALGFTSALAAPIVRHGQAIGAIVLLFSPRAKVDEGTVSFIETVSALLGAAGTFDARDIASASVQMLNQPSTTSLVLLGASVAHQLEGPVSALDLQLEEQRRLLAELRLVTDDDDTVVTGTVAELAELTDEISAAVSRLGDTTQQLTQLGSPQRSRESVDLADVAREAVSILRPWLEARGIALDAQLNPGGVVSIQRDSIMQVALDMITIAAELGEDTASSPRVSVHTNEEGERVVLSIDGVGAALGDAALRDIHEHPFSSSTTDERRRLVLLLAGDVAAAHGGYVEVVGRDGGGSSYRLVVPTSASAARESGNFPLVGTSVELPDAKLHDVLIVDDDPVFSRAARRALRPHRVRETATASEAEFHLLQSRYEPTLVVCDLMLPGSDGTDLHARIREARPALARRFLFVTGGTLSKSTADYIRESGCLAFHKPFDFTRLRRQLSRCTAEAIASDLEKSLQVESFKPIHL